MPDFDYSHMVVELRNLIIEDIKQNPDWYSEKDIHKAYNDDWFVARYLLRVKLDMRQAHQMLKKAMKFRNGPTVRITEFPPEFYQIGAIFGYEPDRKGNIPVYLRIKMHQKIALLQDFLKAFLFQTIEKTDEIAKGKGICLIFDLQGAGISNMDMDLLFFVITTLVNYFPKGLSYMLIHELPWMLRSFWQIAKQWLSDDHRDLVKFSDAQTIYEYIEEQNLPDFMGGTCKRNYRVVPENCISLHDAVKKFELDEKEVEKIKSKFAEFLPQDCETEEVCK